MAFEDLVVAKAVVDALLSSIRRGRRALGLVPSTRVSPVETGYVTSVDRAGQKVVGVLMIVAAIGIGAAVAAGVEIPRSSCC